MLVHALGCITEEELKLRQLEPFIMDGKPVWSWFQRKASLFRSSERHSVYLQRLFATQTSVETESRKRTANVSACKTSRNMRERETNGELSPSIWHMKRYSISVTDTLLELINISGMNEWISSTKVRTKWKTVFE